MDNLEEWIDEYKMLCLHQHKHAKKTDVGIDMKHIIQYIQRYEKDIQVLDLSDNNWDSDTFIYFTHEIQLYDIRLKNLQCLILNNNPIRIELFDVLIFWLELAEIKYIVFNNLGFTSIQKFYENYNKSGIYKDKIIKYIDKIMCLYTCKSFTVSTKYEFLVQNKIISNEWINIQKAFFKSEFYQQYKTIRKNIEYVNTMRSIGRTGSYESLLIEALQMDMFAQYALSTLK